MNGTFSVSFQGTPGITYSVQSEDSVTGEWRHRQNVTAPSNGLILIEDLTAGVRQQFYRLVYPAE